MQSLQKHKYILLLIPALIALIWLWPKGCSDEVKQPNHDSIYHYENVDNNILELTLKYAKNLEKMNDSLMLLKPKVIIRYKTKFDSLILADTSCQNSLIMLYNSFGELNDLNDSIIANNMRSKTNDSITIETLFHKVSLKQSRIAIDSVRIVQLNDTISRVKRRGFIKGFLYGFGIGAAAKEGFDLLSKVKP